MIKKFSQYYPKAGTYKTVKKGLFSNKGKDIPLKEALKDKEWLKNDPMGTKGIIKYLEYLVEQINKKK